MSQDLGRPYGRVMREMFGERPPGTDSTRFFGRIAVELGFITETQLEEALEEQRRELEEGRDAPLGQILIRRGNLRTDQFVEILRAQTPATFSTHPTTCIGRYRVLREIGRGGMGRVLEAEDPLLKRRVALKILKEGSADPEVLERLHREAEIEAQLRHPNIVAIHEVGVAPDAAGTLIHYIALDYVEGGRTLEHVIREGKAQRKDLLRVLETAADAVGHAHVKGVIHRDLKPGNILLEESGRVLLTDFGLARSFSSTGDLTRLSTRMGTPPYMSPEQVEGRTADIDARADVYALGAILYEILVGRPPFHGASAADLYRKIVSAPPIPPRAIRRAVPADLEFICLKALAKEPEARYPTAAEFAQDLRRFRNGEPIEARPSTILYRTRKRLVKRRGPVALVAAVTAVLGIGLFAFGVLWPRLRREEARLEKSRAKLSETEERLLLQMRARLRAYQETALDLRRAGKLDRMRLYAEKGEEASRDILRVSPDLAEPYYRLGRLDRALMRGEEALHRQDEALKRDPGYAPARYERILLQAEMLRARIERRRNQISAGGIAEPPPSQDEILRSDPEAGSLWERIQNDLIILVSGDRSGLGPGQVECALGLSAWIRGDLSPARAHLRRAIELSPYGEEAYAALATLEREEGRFDESIEIWTVARGRDEGYLPHLKGRADTYLRKAVSEAARKGPLESYFTRARNDYATILALDPTSATARIDRGYLFLLEALHSPDKEYARARFEAAAEEFTRVIEDAPNRDEAWTWRGGTYVNLGNLRHLEGKSPVRYYRAALADFEAALRLNPDRDFTWLFRGNAYTNLAVHLERRRDPTEFFEKARDDYDRGGSVSPDSPLIRQYRGILLSNWGQHLMEKGEDPTRRLREAEQEFSLLLVRRSNDRQALFGRGRARHTLAAYYNSRQGDPLPWYRGTIEDLGKAIDLGYEGEAPWRMRGMSRVDLGLVLARRGEDPRPLYRSALEDFAGAQARDSAGRHAVELWIYTGHANLNWGAYLTRKGEDASKPYRDALEAYTRAERRHGHAIPKIQGFLRHCRDYLAKRRR